MEWISVKDRVPEHGQKIKIKTFDLNDQPIEIDAVFEIHDIDEYHYYWSWIISKDEKTIARPTHWMPLPIELSSPSEAH